MTKPLPIPREACCAVFCTTLAVATLASGHCWGCKDDDDGDIMRVETISAGGIAIVAIVVVAAIARNIRAGRWRPNWPLLPLIALHPGWWLSARGGDCGALLLVATFIGTPVLVVIGLWLGWGREHGVPRPSSNFAKRWPKGGPWK